MFQTVFIIGLGLMGGSLAIDLKKKKLAKTILGHSRKKSNLTWAKKQGIIDEGIQDIEEGIQSADLIVLGVPVGAISDLLKQIEIHAKSKTLVIDLGSTKEGIMNIAKKINFIGCHPMTGLEKSGVRSAVPNLYKDKTCIITPHSGKNSGMNRVKKLWNELGSKVVVMDAKVHDKTLAYSSHLPQMISYILESIVQTSVSSKILKSVIGNGYRDTTRIASSAPEMWMDIIDHNRKNLLIALKKYQNKLNQIISWIESKQDQKILKYFTQVSEKRKKLK